MWDSATVGLRATARLAAVVALNADPHELGTLIMQDRARRPLCTACVLLEGLREVSVEQGHEDLSHRVNLIIGAVDQRDVGVATGLNTISRTVGATFGAAAAAAVLGRARAGRRHSARRGWLHRAFWIGAGAGAGLLALLAPLAVPRPDRREHQRRRSSGPLDRPLGGTRPFLQPHDREPLTQTTSSQPTGLRVRSPQCAESDDIHGVTV